MIKHQNMHTQEKTAQFVWTLFILMFFVIQACIWTFAISVTANDASHAVVEGYDEQALTWDEVKSARNASQRLKWSVSLFVDPSCDVHGNRQLTLQLTDKNNNPVVGARLEVDCFHRGTASDRQTLELKSVGPGIYNSSIHVQKHGKWCVAGTATVGKQQLLINEIISIGNSNDRVW